MLQIDKFTNKKNNLPTLHILDWIYEIKKQSSFEIIPQENSFIEIYPDWTIIYEYITFFNTTLRSKTKNTSIKLVPSNWTWTMYIWNEQIWENIFKIENIHIWNIKYKTDKYIFEIKNNIPSLRKIKNPSNVVNYIYF